MAGTSNSFTAIGGQMTFGISVIIPCKNEEKYISRCVESLLCQNRALLDLEIIVVDNGSTDDTLKILDRFGSKITYYVCPDLNIAGLRNFGVKNSVKEWIAFVDADVEVGRYWGQALARFIEESAEKGTDVTRIITGSTCLIPENPTWIERFWYDQLMLRDASETKYINSGNLILHREMMGRLGGFDTSYETGEEENLCEIARLYHNGIIIKNADIKAIHHGYPKDIGGFFRRMRWHGAGMSMYLLKPWKSKPLMLALYYLFLTASYLLFLFISNNYIILTSLFILLQVAPVFLYAAKRYGGTLKQISILSFLYLCFGWAKAVSMFDMILHRHIVHKHK
jgi:glycosyltransferase involved in cell wall biosynthesis